MQRRRCSYSGLSEPGSLSKATGTSRIARVAGLLEVGGHAQHEPGRVVVEASADVVVAALGQRLVLVIGAAGRQLRGSDVEDALAGPLRDHVDEAEQILVGVAEAHATADARLEQGGRPRQVERHHALVGVPDVDHAIDVLVAGLDVERAQQIRPVVAQGLEGRRHGRRLEVLLDDRLDGPLVDRLRTGRIELAVLRVLAVAEHEDDFLRLAGGKLEPDVVRADRLPAVGLRIGRLAALDDDRAVPAAVGPEERVALRVEAGQRLRAGEVGEVVAPLAVLRLVVDDAILDLDLAYRVVALEVGVVFERLPQAELDRAEERHLRRRGPLVRDAHPPDLEVLAERHEVARLGPDPAQPRPDDRVAQAVAAAVVLEIALDRLPARAPEVARVVVAKVDVPPAQVERRVVVAVSGQTPKARVAVEGVAAGRVRDDPEVAFAAQVVDPGQRRVRSRNDVLALVIVEVAVAHPISFCDLPGCRRMPTPGIGPRYGEPRAFDALPRGSVSVGRRPDSGYPADPLAEVEAANEVIVFDLDQGRRFRGTGAAPGRRSG